MKKTSSTFPRTFFAFFAVAMLGAAAQTDAATSAKKSSALSQYVVAEISYSGPGWYLVDDLIFDVDVLGGPFSSESDCMTFKSSQYANDKDASCEYWSKDQKG